MDAARALVILKELLDEADVRLVEQLLIECAKEADFQVNEREYGEGRYPDDAECDRVVGHKGDQDITRAIELGNMKHAAAFDCVRQKILTRFPDNLSIEPSYAPGSAPGQPVLTDIGTGTLRPDIVLHRAHNPAQVQCVYDFKFPCKAARKSDPPGDVDSDVRRQLSRYDKLGGNCPSAVVTPQLGINHD